MAQVRQIKMGQIRTWSGKSYNHNKYIIFIIRFPTLTSNFLFLHLLTLKDQNLSLIASYNLVYLTVKIALRSSDFLTLLLF